MTLWRLRRRAARAIVGAAAVLLSACAHVTPAAPAKEPAEAALDGIMDACGRLCAAKSPPREATKFVLFADGTWMCACGEPFGGGA